MTSILTNPVAFNALRVLSEANDKLEQSSARVSSGNRVASPLDDGGAYNVAQGLRGDLKAYDSVNQQLAQGLGLLEVTLAAGTLISDGLQALGGELVRLADPSVTGDDRARSQARYTALVQEMQGYRDNGSFRGRNLLDGSTAPPGINLLANIDGTMILIPPQDLSTTLDALLPAPTTAAAAVALVDGTNPAFTDAVTLADRSLGNLGSLTTRVATLRNFNEAVMDATRAGLGGVVDADLARESALLEALQTKQQLITQSLSIVNQTPQALLGLFGG